MPEEENIHTKVIDITPTPNNTDRLIADYCRDIILNPSYKPEGVRMTMFMGHWYPSYRGEVLTSIAFLRQCISDAMQYHGYDKNKVFLDLGSGDGIIPIIAASDGYRSQGIEVQTNLNNWAIENARNIAELCNFDPDRVTLHNASYYTKKNWARVTHIADIDDGSIPPFVNNPSSFMDDTGLIGESGKLMADVIYWFASDPYALKLADQWSEIINPGALLLLGPSNQTRYLLKSDFVKDFRYLYTYTREGELGTLKTIDVLIKN